MFVYMFLIGLLVGLGGYALTYVFSKSLENKKRVLTLLVLGILTLIGSITVIGGFEGMPFGVLALGIITISILFSLFGNSTFWKKSVYTFVLIFIALYCAFSYFNKVDYWVIKKTHYFSGDDIGLYVQQLQKDFSIKGYKVFTITEGNKGLVLSLGGEMEGNDIEVLSVKEQGNMTVVTIKSYYNQSDEKNPVIALGLNRLQSEVIVMDTNGTIYEEVSEQP
jgi:hypothetical protein